MTRRSQQSVLIVCSYTWPYSFGGGINSYYFTRYLKSIGINSKILCYKGVGNGIVNLSVPNAIQVAWYNWNSLFKIISLAWIIPISFFMGVSHNIILVNGAHFVGTYFVILGAKLFRRKVVFRSTLWGDDDPKTLFTDNSLIGQYRGQALIKCNVYHAINPSFTQSFAEIFGENKPVVTVTQGVDIDRFNNSYRLTIAGDQNNVLTIISVGFLIDRKGFKEIFDFLSNLDIPFQYIIVASKRVPEHFHVNRFLIEIENLTEYGSNKLGSNVTFCESVEKIEDYYAKADIILLNSQAEGTPNVIMEAMACGVIPIVKELPGFKNFLVKHDENGYLFDNIKTIEPLLQNIRTNPLLRNKMSEAAAKFARENFSFQQTWDELSKAIANA